MRRRLAIIGLVMMFLMGVSLSSASAQSRETEIRSLKDVSAVYVMVEDLDDDDKALELILETIQTDVELKLRLAGIRVMTKEEFLKSSSPYLYVNVGGVMVNPTYQTIRRSVKDKVDNFLNDWLSVNPKK